MAKAHKEVVEIHETCWIAGWNTVTDYHESENNAELFYYWGITKKKTYYYQTQVLKNM